MWIYNDVFFIDKDFENINKLVGVIKIGNKDKLGCFGIGFCIVYNIIDFFSFISCEFIVFFDLEIIYLGDFIKDKFCFGICLNFRNNVVVLSVFFD